jgi:hypothetical protein
MEESKAISILGRSVKLLLLSKDELKGLAIGEMLSFNFYDGSYQDVAMLFVEPKKSNPTPRECSTVAKRLTEWSGLPVVFILKSGYNYERRRLLDKNIYFVMSDKYAHLPMLVAMEYTAERKTNTILTPIAQYLLLYHLQVKSLNGMSARDIAPLVPYSYASVTLGLTCLEDVGLCEKVQDGPRNKIIRFNYAGKGLWQAAQPYMISPIETRFFCDYMKSADQYTICSINALAKYTWLNPDKETQVMMTAKEYRQLKAKDAFENANRFDGNVMVEVWKYPAIGLKGAHLQYVDKLSLALSLKDDTDPRVEGEVERMINELEWKD